MKTTAERYQLILNSRLCHSFSRIRQIPQLSNRIKRASSFSTPLITFGRRFSGVEFPIQGSALVSEKSSSQQNKKFRRPNTHLRQINLNNERSIHVIEVNFGMKHIRQPRKNDDEFLKHADRYSYP